MTNLTYKKGGGEKPTLINKFKKQQTNKKITVISLLAVSLAILLLLSPVFSIRNINVEGIEMLTQEAVISASGIGVGKNIFNFSIKSSEENIRKLAYVNDVKINRKYPSTVKIDIIENVETAYVYFIGNFLGIDSAGKILDVKSKEQPIEKPIIFGTEVIEFGIGNNIKFNDSEKQEAVFTILKQIEDHEMYGMIKTIDVANLYDITLVTKDNCTVKIGRMDDIIYKISFLKKILEEPDDKRGGTIDMTDPQKVVYRGN